MVMYLNCFAPIRPWCEINGFYPKENPSQKHSTRRTRRMILKSSFSTNNSHERHCPPSIYHSIGSQNRSGTVKSDLSETSQIHRISIESIINCTSQRVTKPQITYNHRVTGWFYSLCSSFLLNLSAPLNSTSDLTLSYPSLVVIEQVMMGAQGQID